MDIKLIVSDIDNTILRTVRYPPRLLPLLN